MHIPIKKLARTSVIPFSGKGNHPNGLTMPTLRAMMPWRAVDGMTSPRMLIVLVMMTKLRNWITTSRKLAFPMTSLKVFTDGLMKILRECRGNCQSAFPN